MKRESMNAIRDGAAVRRLTSSSATVAGDDRSAEAVDSGPVRALSAIRTSMEHVRAARSFGDALRAGTRAVCLDCGFDRAVFFSVRDSRLETMEAFFRNRPDWAKKIVEVGRANPTPLTPQLRETEALRRRRAILVSEPMGDPHTPRPVVVASQTMGYVAAPVVCEGQVVGFIHADRHFSGEKVDRDDLEVLWAFAEGFGAILDVAASRERAEKQRRAIERVLGVASGDVWDASSAGEATAMPVAATTAFTVVPPTPDMPTVGLNGPLTRREYQILRLLAAGRTNAAIADELVITVNTVKSHVKHIMRKLGAANRAEAAACFHGAHPEVGVARRTMAAGASVLAGV